MYEKLYFKANKEAERRRSEMDPGVPWVLPEIDPSRAVPDIDTGGFMVRPGKEEPTGYGDDDFMTTVFMALSGEREKMSRDKDVVSEVSATAAPMKNEHGGMDPEAVDAFKKLSRAYPNLNVTSAYRSPKKNEAVGGAKHSQHMHGKAFDISVADLSQEERISLIKQARRAGFKGIGVYNNSLHFDVGPARAWGPSYRSKSLPEWAHEAVYGEL